MESQQPKKSVQIVTDHKAAQILMDDSSENRRTLELFFRKPMIVSEAAKIGGASKSAMDARLKKLVKVKLLNVHQVMIRGRSTSCYSLAADEFVVPLRFVPKEIGDKYIRRLSAVSDPIDPNVGKPRNHDDTWSGFGALVSAGHARRRRPFEATLVSLDGQNRPILPPNEGLLSPTESALWSSEVLVELDRKTAKAFQKELAELAERFKKSQSAAEQPYRVILVMMPKENIW